MFSIDDRDRLRDRVLQIAAADPRVVAGTVVGSLAQGPGDRLTGVIRRRFRCHDRKEGQLP